MKTNEEKEFEQKLELELLEKKQEHARELKQLDLNYLIEDHKKKVERLRILLDIAKVGGHTQHDNY